MDFGYDFFALDMRKCGRSIISPEQDLYRHYCTDMHEYDEEITLSIEHMNKFAQEYSKKKLMLLGHSTGKNNSIDRQKKTIFYRLGGLTAALYALSGPKRDELAALLLNSPNLVELDKTMWQAAQINLIIATGLSTDVIAG